MTSTIPGPARDKVRIGCPAPGEEVVAVWLDAAGRARRLLTHRIKEEEVDVLQYPERPAPISGPPGTNMIFVCRGRPIGDAELQACFHHEPPPPIPDDVFLQLQRLSTVVPIRPLPPHSPEAAAVARAKRLHARHRLALTAPL